MEASIYCMRMVDSWAIIDGSDSLAVSAICCLRLMFCPFCICDISAIGLQNYN